MRLLLTLLCLGCLHVPTAPVTAMRASASPGAVASCRALRTAHDGWSIAGFTASALSGASAGAVALLPSTDTTQRLTLGLVGLSLGALAAVAVEVSSLWASDFAAGDCARVLQ